MRTIPSSPSFPISARFTRAFAWTLAVTLSTNVMTTGVLSAQAPGADSPRPVDLSTKAIRDAAFPARYRPASGVPAPTRIPQSGARIDYKPGGKPRTLGLLITALISGIVGGTLAVSSSKPGETCDTVDYTSCSLQKGVAISGLSIAAVTGIAAIKTRPGPNGVRTVTGTTTNQSATTVITNRTSHALEVTMEGPVERRVVIPSKATQSIELQAGQYRQTVRAMGVDAEPYLAVQVYERSTAYKEGYYLRK